MVASWGPRAGEGRVSIPFIAGQWSLRAGAVAAPEAPLRVSIPFIAGQWSLHMEWDRSLALAEIMSQSPSLRGSGRFKLGWFGGIPSN